jgi:serine phosphatase RsbU (regulator of sigma subunit)
MAPVGHALTIVDSREVGGPDMGSAAGDAALVARVLDGAPVFLAYFDARLVLAVCNTAAARALGHTPEEAIGLSLPELLGKESPMVKALIETVHTGEPRSLVLAPMFDGPEEEPRTFAGSLVPDLDASGGVRGVFASAFDITDQVLELRMTARLAESLNVILQAIARMDDPMELLDTLASESLKAVHGDYSVVSIRSGRSWVVTHHHGTGGEARVGMDYPLDERPVVHDAATSGQVQYIEDALEDPRTNKSIMERFGVKSFVAVPLTLRGETLGVFEIVFAHAAQAFDEPTRAYLSNLASAASLAYGRIREYQHEHRIADALQAALLRLPSEVRGLRFASHYAAASDEALVGGDFFDVFEIDAGRVGITIGDVSGKGLSAAIITSRVRDSLRLCALDGLDPAACVTKTNRLLYQVTPSDVFATLIFGILNTVSGDLVYVSAAHPPAVLQRNDGSIVLLEGSGSVVGGFMTLEFAEKTVTLDHGDAVVFYTDGLTEARRDGEMYGLERMVEFLGVRRRSSLEALVNDVFNNVREYTRSRLRDDVAMLAITLDRPAERPRVPGDGPA